MKGKAVGRGSEDDEGGDSCEGSSDDGDDLITPTRKRKRPTAVSAMGQIALALDSMSKSADDGLAGVFEELLEQNGDAFSLDELSRLGLVMSDMPGRFAIYKSMKQRTELRRSFPRKMLLEEDG
ncbi:hypothetical protein OC834_005320 [Tilletia horrida]|nr:hypothetical protein OC834_005320 [Tilletia horrida]KAK0559720.1 hypothetical protein OC844_004221 [Tilletia horrida]